MASKKKPTKQEMPIQPTTNYSKAMIEDVMLNNISFSDFLAKYGYSQRVYNRIKGE